MLHSAVQFLKTRRYEPLLKQMYSRVNDLSLIKEKPAGTQSRSNSKIRFKTDRPRKAIYFRSPMYRGSKAWDDLPLGIQEATSAI